MNAKLLFLLVLVVANDITALLLNQRLGNRGYKSRYQSALYDGQAQYDPFESDPKMLAMMGSELSLIKVMNSTSIKLELTAMGITSKGLVDKVDLEKLLARKRVTTMLQKTQVDVESDRINEQRANMIEDEIKRIKSSGMTELMMVNELHLSKVKFDVSEDLSHQLALARLGIPTAADIREKMRSEVRDASNQNVESIYTDTFDDLKGVYNRFVSNVEGIIPNTTVNIDSLLAQQAVTDTLKSVKEYTKNIGLTKSEQEALAMTSAETSPIKQSRGAQSDIKNTKVSTRILSDDEIVEAIASASKRRSFDDIVNWARSMDRDELAQILQYRKEDVPKYATRSGLAAILADSILVDRTNLANDHSSDNFGINFMANSDVDQIADNVPTGFNAPWEIIDETRVGASEGKSDINEKINEKRRKRGSDTNSNRRRSVESKEMTSFFFEKELFGKFSDLISGAIKNVFGDELFSELKSGGTRRSLISFFNRIINLGCKSCITAATWAGGALISPNKILFIITTYCLLFKKGILTFLASFLFIRAVREIIFVRDTFNDNVTPSPAPAKNN